MRVPDSRPDLLYPTEGLCIEYDGDVHRSSLAADNQRQNRLVNAGYRLLRYTAADIFAVPKRSSRRFGGLYGVAHPETCGPDARLDRIRARKVVRTRV